MGETYLSEALAGGYKYRSEDRLSQIFSASFNNSKAFRQGVSGFFKLGPLGHAASSTQRQYRVPKGRAKLDILLHNQKGEPLVAIENKIEAPLKRNQLKKYNSIVEIRGRPKFCFVKYYKGKSDLQNQWDIRYWADFYLHLVSMKARDEFDEFTDHFMATLKEYGMERPSEIKKADLKTLARALYSIRSDKPYISNSGPTFETLATLERFLEDLFRRAARDEILQKRAGKKFRPKMKVSWWYDKKKKGRQWLWIGCEAQLAKPRKGVKSLGAALVLYGKPEKYDLVAYVTDADDNWRDDDFTYPKKDVACLPFQAEVIKYWAGILK